MIESLLNSEKEEEKDEEDEEDEEEEEEKEEKEGKNDNKKEEVRRWLLETVELPEYINNFINQGFDELNIIKSMTMNELIEIGLKKLGHRKKILNFIQKLNYPNNHHNININGESGQMAINYHGIIHDNNALLEGGNNNTPYVDDYR